MQIALPHIIDVIKRYVFKNRIKKASDKQTLAFNKQVYLSEEFEALWNKINPRTRYRVNFETEDLIKRAGKGLKRAEAISPPQVSMTRVSIDITEAGVSADRQLETKSWGCG